MKRLTLYGMLLLIMLAATGCASIQPMAFDRSTPHIDPNGKAIVLMAVDLYRDDGSRYNPHPINLILTRPNGTVSGEMFGFHFTEDADAVIEDTHKIYLARFSLDAGNYQLLRVLGDANAFPFHGWFDVPLLAPLTATAGSVTYVGRVTAKLRPRENNEFRAGPLIPLVDQALTGVSTSTWDITIDNQADKDLALFRQTFPALVDTQIAVASLPPFDREAAQKAWEGIK